MEKMYKVGVNVHFNETLHKVKFHSEMTLPLYVQITHERKKIAFKSYYFDHFSAKKYSIQVGNESIAPKVSTIIDIENNFLSNLIKKQGEDFVLSEFKSQYNYWSTDILDLCSEGFNGYLHTFLVDEGYPFLAESLFFGNKNLNIANVLGDLKKMSSPLMKKMEENAIYYAPPYLPLYKFALDQRKNRSPIFLSFLDFISQKESFSQFLERQYSSEAHSAILSSCEKIIQSAKPK